MLSSNQTSLDRHDNWRNNRFEHRHYSLFEDDERLQRNNSVIKNRNRIFRFLFFMTIPIHIEAAPVASAPSLAGSTPDLGGKILARYFSLKR